MNNNNGIKGSFSHQEVDVSLFPKDSTNIHSEHYRSYELNRSNQSSENRERSDSIKLLKETLEAKSETEIVSKPRTGITPSPSQDNLLGLNFQIELPKKSLKVPRQTIHRHSVSLPVTPSSSPKLERRPVGGGLLRKFSGTNLVQMGIVPEHMPPIPGGEMDKNDNRSVTRRDSKLKSGIPKELVDSASISAKSNSQAANASWLVSSGFGNWLKKKTNLDNKEMNAMAPSF